MADDQTLTVPDAILEAEAQAAPAPAPAPEPMRLYLVDGSGYIFRAFHALPPLTRKTDGLPVGAVSGFCNMLWKFLADMRSGSHELKGPTHLAVVFDKSEKTFRTAISAEYKAHRPPPPEDLIPQFPLVREATRAFGVPAIELEGYEADDLIAAYAKPRVQHRGRGRDRLLRQGPDAARERAGLHARSGEGQAHLRAPRCSRSSA